MCVFVHMCIKNTCHVESNDACTNLELIRLETENVTAVKSRLSEQSLVVLCTITPSWLLENRMESCMVQTAKCVRLEQDKINVRTLLSPSRLNQFLNSHLFWQIDHRSTKNLFFLGIDEHQYVQDQLNTFLTMHRGSSKEPVTSSGLFYRILYYGPC